MQNTGRALALRTAFIGSLLAVVVVLLALVAARLWPARSAPARWIVLHPDGPTPLLQRMREEIAQARALSTTPVVYIGATWCPPCQSIKKKQQQLREVLIGTTIIEINLADWQKVSGLEESGFRIDKIPVFYTVDRHDRAARGLEGSDWQGQEPTAALATLVQNERTMR